MKASVSLLSNQITEGEEIEVAEEQVEVTGEMAVGTEGATGAIGGDTEAIGGTGWATVTDPMEGTGGTEGTEVLDSSSREAKGRDREVLSER